MKNNKLLKFLSTALVALLIISIAPMNESVVTEMKSSANGVIKSIGEVFEKIDFTLPEIDIKATAAERDVISDMLGSLTSPQKESFTYEIKRNKSTSTLTINCSGKMPHYYEDTAPWSIYQSYENLVIKGDAENIGQHAFYKFTNLKKVTIEAPVKAIGYEAFYGCSSLTSVSLPDSLKTIANEAFQDCSSLKKIVIPENVTAIGSAAFGGCPLKSLTIPFTGGGTDNDNEIVTNELGYIFGTKEFDNSYSVKSKTNSKMIYYVPNTLKTVTLTKTLYKYGFCNHVGIEKIVIADTVKSSVYPKYFAYGCTGLKSVVTNTDKIVGVGADAFVKCSSLTEFVLPDSIKWIGEYAFNNCTSLVSVSFPEKDFYVRRDAFKNTPFWDGKTEEFVIVGDGILVKYNGTDTNVVIPEGVKRVCCAFDNRTEITNIQLPQSLEYISPDSFYGCLGITELIVPDSVIEINEGAFTGMCKLKKLSVPFIGKNKNVKADTEEALISYWFEEYNDYYVCNVCRSDSCIRREQYYNNGNNFRRTWQPKKLVDLIVTGGTFHSYCLTDYYIKNITISAGVEGIEPYGLYDCGIENVNFESLYNPEFLPDYALAENKITHITLPLSIKKLGSVFVGNPLAEITLHEGVEELDGTFQNTKLTRVTFPDSLLKINGKAFAECRDITEIVIGENINEISNESFIDTNIVSFSVDSDNPKYYDENGILYSKEGDLIAYPSGNTSSTYEINADVRKIDDISLTQLRNVSKIIVDKNNQDYFSCDGVLYDKTGKLIKYPDKKTDTTFVMDSRVVILPAKDSPFFSHIERFEIDEANSEYKSIDGVVYNKDVTEIVLYPQKKKADYTAPDSVKKVQNMAFYNTNLLKLEFPNDVDFEQECFYKANMEELVAVNFPHKLAHYFGYYVNFQQPFDPANIKRIELTNQTSDLEEFFASTFRFEEIKINGSFKNINKCAFDITLFKELALPDSVEHIGEKAFSQSRIEKLVLGNSLKSIGKSAFSASWELHIIELPESLEYIGDYAFAQTGIEEIILWDNITHIGRVAFSGSKLKRAVINESLVEIADEIFKGCEHLETVVVGGAVKEIESKAFAECPSLKSVVIPDGVENISKDAFDGSKENLTIYCNEDSYAEKYAEKNNIQYTTLVLDSIENQIYTGEEIRPAVGASANGKRLALNTEYTVDYKNNINAGSAKIIARGLGDFKAIIAVGQFTILPKEMENIEIISQDAEYDPIDIDFKVDVFLGELQLMKDVDYELVTESKLCDVGENNIAVCGIGNYAGITNITVNVLPRNIANATIKTGKNVVVTDKGQKLIKDIDYIETRSTDENGKETIGIKGVGNYDGAVYFSEGNRISVSFFDKLIEFIQSFIKMLMI